MIAKEFIFCQLLSLIPAYHPDVVLAYHHGRVGRDTGSRWNLEGMRKSDGIRAIYYWVVNIEHIHMLYVDSRGQQANLAKAQLAQLKTIVEQW